MKTCRTRSYTRNRDLTWILMTAPPDRQIDRETADWRFLGILAGKEMLLQLLHWIVCNSKRSSPRTGAVVGKRLGTVISTDDCDECLCKTTVFVILVTDRNTNGSKRLNVISWTGMPSSLQLLPPDGSLPCTYHSRSSLRAKGSADNR